MSSSKTTAGLFRVDVVIDDCDDAVDVDILFRHFFVVVFVAGTDSIICCSWYSRASFASFAARWIASRWQWELLRRYNIAMFVASACLPFLRCRFCSSRTATREMYRFIFRSSDPLRVFFSRPLHSLSRPSMSCSYVPARTSPMRRVRDCLIIQFSFSVNHMFLTSFFFMSERGGIDLISALRANDTDRLVAGEANADAEEHSDRRRLLDDTDDDLFTLVESIIVDVDVYGFV